jgi:hypothetical protein
MRQFNNLLKKYLADYNSDAVVDETSVMYEQYVITEKKGHYYLFLNNKIIGSAKSLVEAKQRCDTINSGC